MPFTESHTKFVMIHLERGAAAYRADLPLHRITVGGPFPPFNRMLRVTLGWRAIDPCRDRPRMGCTSCRRTTRAAGGFPATGPASCMALTMRLGSSSV
jgi:hypothetical protein